MKDEDNYSIADLERLMVEHGIVLRAIPLKIRHILEASHIAEYPNGKIMYLEKYNREMLVFESTPTHAGEFIFEFCRNTMAQVNFHGKIYYRSINEALNDLPRRLEELK